MCRRRIQSFALVATIAFGLLAARRVAADTLTFQPVADTTLIGIAPDNNLGGAGFFNAGAAGNGYLNRALLRFDLTIIPTGSQILGVSLTMDVVREPAADRQNSLFSLRQVFVPWGEGIQVPAESNSPGLGSLAAPGEATWNHRFAGGAPWTVPGGRAGTDFSTVLSSTAFVYGIGDPVQFESTPELIADLQHWVDNPGANFGWLMMTESEDVRRTARGFASRESGFGPTLTVEFVAVPEPSSVVLAGLSAGVVAWGLRRRLRGSAGNRSVNPGR